MDNKKKFVSLFELKCWYLVDTLHYNLRSLGKDFLEDIQILHDINAYWNEDSKGLSEIGKTKLVTIIKQYGLDKNLFTDYLN